MNEPVWTPCRRFRLARPPGRPQFSPSAGAVLVEKKQISDAYWGIRATLLANCHPIYRSPKLHSRSTLGDYCDHQECRDPVGDRIPPGRSEEAWSFAHQARAGRDGENRQRRACSRNPRRAASSQRTTNVKVSTISEKKRLLISKAPTFARNRMRRPMLEPRHAPALACGFCYLAVELEPVR
jgi:hypothetical protein